MEQVKEPPYPDLMRGVTIYRNTGELSFETRPQLAGTFPVTFLEWCRSEDPFVHNPWYARVINEYGRIEAVPSHLICAFNI